MPELTTEFASAGRGVGNAYESLSRWAGVPLETVVESARNGTLNALVEQRQLTGPLSGREALRRIESLRRAPWEKPRSPAEMVGELRAIKAIWEAREAEAERRDPRYVLAELRRQRVSWEN